MIYTGILIITLVALLLLIIIIYYSKFSFIKEKIKISEESIESSLVKKIDILKEFIPLLIKQSKKHKKTIDLKEIDDDLKIDDYYELYASLSDYYIDIKSVIDDNEKLLKKDDIKRLYASFNGNEENLLASLKYYNDSVLKYNKLCSTFPSNIFGFIFRCKKKGLYYIKQQEMYKILNED